MGDIYVVDNDFIDKLAKIDELEMLRLEGNKIVITDKVYEAQPQTPSATRQALS